jgi:hypothetical protein
MVCEPAESKDVLTLEQQQRIIRREAFSGQDFSFNPL